jgi:hypothetical protein
MTLAPPPATIVQMRPFGFKTVNLREALVWNNKGGISNLGIRQQLYCRSSISHENQKTAIFIGKQIEKQNRDKNNSESVPSHLVHGWNFLKRWVLFQMVEEIQ